MRRTVSTAMSRRLRRYSAALATTVVVVTVGACAVDGANTSPDVYGTANSAGFYPRPPQVRQLADNSVRGTIVYQGWINNGIWREDQAKSVPHDLPPARLRLGKPLVFELAAVSLPAWVDLSVFASTGSDGQPAGEPERIVCGERMPCTVELAKHRRTLRITARPAEAGRFVALNIGWHRSVASKNSSFAPESPPEVSATWAFAVAWTSVPKE